MAELSVDYLSMLSYDETNKSTQTKKRPVTSIIEWGQCFTQYIAILTQAKPERTTDLLGYQHLILQAHLEYDGDGWMVYDRFFSSTDCNYTSRYPMGKERWGPVECDIR